MSGTLAGHATSKRQRLLSLLLEQEGLSAAGPMAIERADRSAALPLSFAQQRLWVLDRLLVRRSLYNAPLAYRLHGPLDTGALRAAFTQLVARHEALRTAFPARAGGPAQVISPPGPVGVKVVSLAGMPSAQAEVEAARLAQAEADAPFDLENGPLLRVTLVRLADDDNVLLISMHHILSDSWSLRVMFGELEVLYEAAAGGSAPAPLPDLAVQYADYAVWQRQRMSSERVRRELDYWKEKLDGAPRMVTFPGDRPRQATSRFDGGVHEFAVPHLDALKALAADQDATMYMVLLAAFKVLLARYSGESDIVVGTPVAGRDRVELEPLIGFFVNAVALRTSLDGDPGFTEVVQRVRRTALDAYHHQELPFERLVDEIQPARQLSVHPLFQVSFQLFQAQQDLGHLGRDSLALPGVAVDAYKTGTRTSKFDLAVELEDHPGGLRGHIEYSTELYDADTIERITSNFLTLLDGVIARPEQPLSELPMLAPRERLRIMEEWNDTGRLAPDSSCLHELIAAQAARTPEAPALIYESQTLTYRPGQRAGTPPARSWRAARKRDRGLR
jgi:hypothetical protein